MKTSLQRAIGISLCVFAFAVSFNAQSDDRRRPVITPVSGNFDIEVLVDGYPLENIYGRGRSRYVEAIKGAEYELRIRNPLGIRVAVALFVDGLNTIDARRTSAEKATKWVIEPYGTMVISGWQMSDSRARRFYFTTENDSYARKIGQPADFGNITAAFFREKRRVVIQPKPRIYKDDDVGIERPMKRETKESTESNKPAGSADSTACCPPPRRDEQAATGIGRDMRHDVQWIDVDLEERSTATVTIRYEYRDSLVRMGLRPRDNSQIVVKPKRDSVTNRRYAPEP